MPGCGLNIPHVGKYMKVKSGVPFSANLGELESEVRRLRKSELA
jgi:hypothetical protein